MPPAMSGLYHLFARSFFGRAAKSARNEQKIFLKATSASYARPVRFQGACALAAGKNGVGLFGMPQKIVIKNKVPDF